LTSRAAVPARPTLSLSTVNHSPGFGAPLSIEAVLDAAAGTGWPAVGLDTWSIAAFLAAGGSVASLGRMLRERRLACTDVVALVIDGNGAATESEARTVAAVADATGATVCGAAFAVPPDDSTVAALGRSAEVLWAHGVRLAIEFAPYSGLPTVAEAAAVAERIGWDRAGLLIDAWQTHAAGQVAAVTSLPPGRIALVQVADARLPLGDDIVDASRNRRLLPGAGDLDLAAFVAAVDATGFAGPVSPEVLSAQVRSTAPAEFARAALAAVRALCA
jgi:sugar phosphate isomerase/epimerase